MTTDETLQVELGKKFSQALAIKAEMMGIDAALIPEALARRYCDAMWILLVRFENELQDAARKVQ